ncbi:MAG: hypothetical protein IJS71_00720 [Clostridia bacterium]|nr:hypothetical protein [Clostridia bacterium]
MNIHTPINQIRPDFYSASMTTGKVNVPLGRDFICFLIVEHIDDESFILEQVDDILIAGCKGFGIYGAKKPLWHRLINRENFDLSIDDVDIVTTARFDSEQAFVRALSRELKGAWPEKNDVYILYDDEKLYEQVLQKVLDPEK